MKTNAREKTAKVLRKNCSDWALESRLHKHVKRERTAVERIKEAVSKA
jgi:hypothetical protein